MDSIKNIYKRSAISIGELAMMFFPNSTKESSEKQFKKWINRSPELLKRLMDAGYKKGVSLLSIKQIDILLDHFGSPFDDDDNHDNDNVCR